MGFQIVCDTHQGKYTRNLVAIFLVMTMLGFETSKRTEPRIVIDSSRRVCVNVG